MPKTKREPTTREIIGRNIKIILALRGMNQTVLAERLAVTSGTVSHWLSGRSDMGIDGLGRVARVLQITPEKLLAAPEEVAENCTRLIC